jgi:hypothetical protein
MERNQRGYLGMTVTINIHGENATEALRELSGLSSGLLAKPPSTPAPQPPVDNDHVAEGATQFTTAETAASAPKATRTRKKADAPADAGPVTGPEDDAATQAQDKADEQAEVEQNRDPETPLTIEDVKAAVGKYIEKFDMAAAQQDGPQLFVDVLGKPPEGQPYWKMSVLPIDQPTLKKVVDAWTAAAAGNARYQPKA